MVCTLEIYSFREKDVLDVNDKFSEKQCIMENVLNMQDKF